MEEVNKYRDVHDKVFKSITETFGKAMDENRNEFKEIIPVKLLSFYINLAGNFINFVTEFFHHQLKFYDKWPDDDVEGKELKDLSRLTLIGSLIIFFLDNELIKIEDIEEILREKPLKKEELH